MENWTIGFFGFLLNVSIMLVGVGTIYGTVKKDLKWQSDWIKDHEIECVAHEKVVNGILIEMKTSNASMVELLTAHTNWIKSHEVECAVHEKVVNDILIELRTSNARTVELLTAHGVIVTKLETEQMRLRDKTHELGNQVFLLKELKK